MGKVPHAKNYIIPNVCSSAVQKNECGLVSFSSALVTWIDKFIPKSNESTSKFMNAGMQHKCMNQDSFTGFSSIMLVLLGMKWDTLQEITKNSHAVSYLCVIYFLQYIICNKLSHIFVSLKRFSRTSRFQGWQRLTWTWWPSRGARK